MKNLKEYIKNLDKHYGWPEYKCKLYKPHRYEGPLFNKCVTRNCVELALSGCRFSCSLGNMKIDWVSYIIHYNKLKIFIDF